MKTHCIVVALLAAAAGLARAGEPAADFAALSSRVQSMAEGFYPERDWQQVLGQLVDLERRAAGASNWELAVESAVLRAAAVGEARGEPAAAAVILRDTLRTYEARRPVAVRKAYAQLARCYSTLGDEDQVRNLIAQYKSSPAYDPQDYEFSGGWGREVPLRVVRPDAGGGDSLTVTALDVARRQSAAAPGRLFPDFRVQDTAGRTWTPDDFRGKVLLIDVWSRSWTPWSRDLTNLKSLYDRYHLDGLEVLGVSVGPIGADAKAFADQNGMTWPQVVGDQTLPRALGLYGECANFLIDGNGTIVARNLRGGDLVAAVRRALGKSP
jgi:peroxiredoxin